MRLMLERLRRTRGDDGFTLIEMVMSVAILGIVSATLLGVVFQYLKTTSDTSARLNESTDQQFISTYWQNDVSSLGRQTFSGSVPLNAAQSVFVDAAGPGNCGTAVGTVVVAFAWNEFNVNAVNPDNAWNSTPQEVAYVTVPAGSRLLLKRVRCRNGVTSQPQTVARNLTAKPAIACDTTCGSTTSPPNRVSMKFVVKDADNANSPGYTTTVSADRRQG
jgi:prepilin-type N-terminal cleavage/methylation domain-containing protein